MNINKNIAIVLLSMTLIFAGCHPSDDHVIVPGLRVGNLVIDRTNADEVSINGSIEVSINGSITEKYNKQGLGFGFYRDPQDQLLKFASVIVTRPNYRTKEGLSVGSSEEDVIAKYGKPELVDIPIMAGNTQKGMLSKDALHYSGIRWVIGADKRVEMIIVSPN
jgi:hypothetical protein